MTRMLVCGGRDYDDESTLYRVLDDIRRLSHGIDHVCHGAARGADTLAGAWALDWWIPCDEFPAEWDRLGKSAGFIRNKKMLEEFRPRLVVAFPGGRGTANMVGMARSAGVPTLEVDRHGEHEYDRIVGWCPLGEGW